MAYRASQHASTKQSPYYMLYQQQMRLPIDAEILPQSSMMDVGEDNSLNETVGVLLESRSQAFQKAQVNIAKAQKQQKETEIENTCRKSWKLAPKCCLKTQLSSRGRVGRWSP